MPSLELFLHDQRVGSVEPVSRDRSSVSFSVDRSYRPEVLLSESFAALPGRSAPQLAVSNFLGGYVPEGGHRERMAAKRRIDQTDLFALLTEFGGSIAGAVSLRRPDEALTERLDYDPLSERELTAKLQQALDDSDQGIPDDSRSTLPGYQPKLLVASFGDGWLSPHGRAHSTHILKPQVPLRPHRLFDEHFSHQLAGRVGLSNFSSEIRVSGRLSYLAIERFDRVVANDRVTPLHQEDLAQAMSLDWRDTDVKFQEPSWPADPKRATARRIAEVLGSTPSGTALVGQWIRQLTYHVAIGNNDAHAKNVALMHLPGGTELAQVYDALPNLFQDGLVNWNMALAIDGEFDHRRMSMERLLAEVDSWRLMPSPQARHVVSELLESIDSALDEVMPPAGVSPGMVERLHWNVSRLRAGNEISEPKRRRT